MAVIGCPTTTVPQPTVASCLHHVIPLSFSNSAALEVQTSETLLKDASDLRNAMSPFIVKSSACWVRSVPAHGQYRLSEFHVCHCARKHIGCVWTEVISMNRYLHQITSAMSQPTRKPRKYARSWTWNRSGFDTYPNRQC